MPLRRLMREMKSVAVVSETFVDVE